jgi:hypothetical protein
MDHKNLQQMKNKARKKNGPARAWTTDKMREVSQSGHVGMNDAT